MRHSLLNSGPSDFPTFWTYPMTVRVSPLALLINIEPSSKYCGWLCGGEHFYLSPGSFFRRPIVTNFMVNLCLRRCSGDIQASQHACIKAFRQLPESRPASDGRAV